MLVIIIILIITVFYVVSHLINKDIRVVSIDKKNSVFKENKKNGLIALLNNISSADKVILTNIKEKWIMTKDIIDETLNQEVKGIIKNILLSIENISEYKFHINTIENMYVMKDDAGNYRCILNCFIFEVKKYYTIKLSMDIVFFDGEIYFNFIDIDESSINNIINNYDVKWDAMGILSNYDMFDENTRNILDNYYNSNYEIVFLNNKDITIDKTSTFTMSQLVNSYLPANAPVDETSPHFCFKNKEQWKSKGIKIINDEYDCPENDNSYQGFPNLPRNGPSVITHNPDKNNHQWLFSYGHGSLKSSGQH